MADGGDRMTAVVIHMPTGWRRWWVKCPTCGLWKSPGGKGKAEALAEQHNDGNCPRRGVA